MEAWKENTATVTTASANMDTDKTARGTRGARATDKKKNHTLNVPAVQVAA